MVKALTKNQKEEIDDVIIKLRWLGNKDPEVTHSGFSLRVIA